MLVQDFLHQSAERYPDKTALVCGRQRLTYGEMDQLANQLANAFLTQGITRGDRVAVYLPNSIETAVAIFAILKAGGTFVVINQSTKRDKLTYILENCRAWGLLLESRQANLADWLKTCLPALSLCVLCGKRPSHLPAGFLYFDDITARYSEERPCSHIIDRDLACLIYTSGSTGDPKGVMSDHSNVVFAAQSIISYLENRPDDIVIDVLPLSFDYGLYQLLMTFCFGGTLILEKGFAFPAAIMQRIEAERVTGFPGVPTLFAILLQMDLDAYDLSSLRYMTNTAAALPVSHIQALQQKFPGVTLYSMYGLTETKRTLYLPPAELARRPGSVGIAIPGTEVWCEDENGRRLPPGEIGELVVRGRHVMRGYWAAPEATAQRYRPGPLPGEKVCYTGDLFRMDDEGFFYFVGRKDDIIKCRGEKVAPKEVENVLYALPGVVETAVIGIPDPILGQAIQAFIVHEGNNLTESQVMAHCRANLEDFMVPQIITFCDTLPKTSSGKIKKTGLGSPQKMPERSLP
ncbi:MAG: AMP-binding protein [Ardenticatenaceae bacterium]|nr:AMP-binding protein [Ardenticatenaceae bacterium]MCB9443924.1 AMP-binding protein [Ardenticatenaceae bacterium]